MGQCISFDTNFPVKLSLLAEHIASFKGEEVGQCGFQWKQREVLSENDEGLSSDYSDT